MYLYYHKKLPKLFEQYFTSVVTVHKYKTRSATKNNYYLNFINSNMAKKAMQFNGAKFGTICLWSGGNFLFQNLIK